MLSRWVGGNAKGPRDREGVGTGREEEGVEELWKEYEGEGAKRLGRRRGRVGEGRDGMRRGSKG